MRRTFLFLCLVSLAHMFFSQAIKVTYFIQKNDSVDIQLEFKSWVLDSIYRNGKLCIVPRFPHFSTILDSGRPSLSSFHPWLIWDEAFPQIRLISVTDTFFYGGFLPAEKKYLTDYEVASIVSIKDTFKSSDSLYPSDIVKIERRTRAFGQNLVQLGIYPFQYDFVNQKWIFHQKIVFRIANRSIKLKQELPSVLLRNIVLNPFMINKSSHTQIEGYLILTRPTFKFLADSFAMWKTLLGYDVRVVSCPGWTAGSVKDSILAYYFKKDFSLSCVLLLGDVEVIPAVYVQDNQGYYYSDFPYTLLEGDDYFPEVFIGRMPASTVAEARSMIRKVMRYEQNPPLQSSYYQKITLVSHFQDDNNDTYEDRRFSQTIEEIASYLEFLGKGINRIYYADATDDPRYWNNDYFSAGEPVPSHLRKPFFPWNGNYYQIRTAINQGTSLLLYRGHGTINGWSKPSFVRSQLPALNNSLLPLVFSINCQSGNFIENDGFAEEFFKLSGKGAIGVFSHVATSYSGYNDALILGMIDAMFPFPGLNPIFTGTAAQPSVITPHAQLTKPGEIALQGLLRMTQTWGNLWNLEKRTFHLLHYFGDPSMEIMLYPPQTLQVNFFPYVTCHDSLLRVISSNADSITLVVTQNNKILKKLLLKQTDSIVAITPPIAGTPITIAAIKKGYIPHIQQFQVWGNCFKPQLRITGNYCIEEPMKFEVQPSSPFSYVSWNFGPNAISSHASGNGPHEVKFLDDGWHIIEANVQMRDSIYVLRDTIWIDETCPIRASMGKRVIYQCNGTFQTNDTFHFYKPLVTDTLIVISPGASMMQIFALRFQVAAGDTLFIFRFSGNAPFLIDKFYEGKSLSFLQVTGDRFMLIWKSDPSLQGDGIELRWECTPAQLPPIAAAEIVDFDPCSGTIILKDTSRNQPEQITWFFSDGSTYHLPVVVHQFQDTGCYQVSLVVSNNYGNDTLLISPFCLQPLTPPVFSTYFLCQPDFLHFISQDTLLWYVSSFVEHPLKVDTSFTFWYNGQEKVMVRKFRKKDLILAGKQDTSGMGSYINSSFEQRLFFEVLKPIYFESFDVYSMIAQQGRFFLLSSSGDTIWKAALTLVAGKNTIAVKRYLTPGEPYSLVIAPNVILFKNYFSQAFYPAYYENLVKLSGSNSLDGGLFDYPGLYRWRLWDLCLSGFDTIHVNLNFTSLPEEKKYYFCQGDSVRLFSQDTTPVLWMPHSILGSYLDVYNTGTYYAIIEDSSCVNQSSVFEITFLPPAEQVGIIYQQQGLTFTFTPTHSGLVYEWDLGDGTISYLENIVHTYSDSMERTVTLTTYSPCGIAQVDTLIFHHEVITSPSIESENILIYPNPVADFLHIKASEPLNKIEIYTVSGEKLYVFNSDNVKESFFFFPMNLSAGVYYVHVTTHFHVYVACIVVTKK